MPTPGVLQLEDGQLIISSAAAAQGATSCHKARAHLGLPPELPLVVYSNIDLQTKTMGPLIKFYMESDNSVLQPHRAALQEYLQRAQLPAPAGGRCARHGSALQELAACCIGALGGRNCAASEGADAEESNNPMHLLQ